MPGWFRERRVRKSIMYLDRLALALVDAGWASLTLYQEQPPLLRVFDARVPLFGESVAAVRGPFGWYFRSSLGLPLAECAEVELAVVQIDRRLRPVVEALRDVGERG